MATMGKSTPLKHPLDHYEHDGFFDEMFDQQGSVRLHYRRFAELFRSLSPQEFEIKRQAVDIAFLRQGITFNVYGDSAGTERIFPFDLMPRIIPAKEWELLERGPRAAHHRAESLPARHLPRAEDPEGRRHPAVLRSVRRSISGGSS